VLVLCSEEPLARSRARDAAVDEPDAKRVRWFSAAWRTPPVAPTVCWDSWGSNRTLRSASMCERSVYEKPDSGRHCAWGNAVGRRSDQSGSGDICQDAAPTPQVGRSGRSQARSWVRLDKRLLPVGSRAQRPRAVRLDAGQVEAPSAFRRHMGCAKVASRPWRLYLRGGPLALNEIKIGQGICRG
jgi:hypothetical protein